MYREVGAGGLSILSTTFGTASSCFLSPACYYTCLLTASDPSIHCREPTSRNFADYGSAVRPLYIPQETERIHRGRIHTEGIKPGQIAM
jgi:hypothetical protein